MNAIRYYDGFDVSADREVQASEAERLRTHARAFFTPDDRLERVELYDDGHLFRVDYEDGDEQSIRRHSERYPDVPYTTRRTVERAGDLSWEAVRSYGPGGHTGECTLILRDVHGQASMEVLVDDDGSIREVTKYYWEAPDALRYVFSYGRAGDLVDVSDLEDGQSVRFNDLRPHLPDPDFYASGPALPATLADTSLPDCG